MYFLAQTRAAGVAAPKAPMLAVLTSAMAFSPPQRAANSYEKLATTCQNAKAISSKLSVQSVADCEGKCDAAAGCIAVDTDGNSCYLKSHCEGNAGSCDGWCAYRQTGPAPPPPPPPGPIIPLREAAMKRGKLVGAAGNQGHITKDAAYAKKLAEQYSLVTAENGCKWDDIHPGQHTYNFAHCDVVHNFAHANSMKFRGHNLCWGNQNPSWLTNGQFSRDQMQEILENHTQTVAAHYGDGAIAWDVVNEAVSDGTGSGSAKLKDNVWYPKLKDYIVSRRMSKQKMPYCANVVSQLFGLLQIFVHHGVQVIDIHRCETHEPT